MHLVQAIIPLWLTHSTGAKMARRFSAQRALQLLLNLTESDSNNFFVFFKLSLKWKIQKQFIWPGNNRCFLSSLFFSFTNYVLLCWDWELKSYYSSRFLQC